MDTVLLGGIIALLLLTAFAGQHGKDTTVLVRQMWAVTLIGVMEAMLLPWPQRLLLLGILLNVQRIPQPSSQKSFLEQVLAVTGGYLLLRPYLQVTEVESILWTVAGIGAGLGIHTLFSFWYVWKYPLLTQSLDKQPLLYYFQKVLGPLTVELGEVRLSPGGYTCGQLMPNWLHAIACLSVAATCGLTITGNVWAWGLMPFVLVPILATVPCPLTRHFGMAGPVNQCVVHLIVLACAVGIIIHPVRGLNALAVLAALAAFLAYRQYQAGFPPCVDSGRLDEWYHLMKYWVLLKSYSTYLFGHGIRSWVVLSNSRSQIQQTPNYFSMAHNEYVQHLFEYGVVGLMALVWYIGGSLYTAYAVHHGLFLVGMVMASVALVSFPWAFYHVINFQVKDQQGRVVMMRSDNYGSPFLFWLSFVLAVITP